MKLTPLFLTLATGALFLNAPSAPAQDNMSSTNDTPNMANPLRTPHDSQNTNLSAGAMTNLDNAGGAYRRSRRNATNMADTVRTYTNYATNYNNSATNADNTGINRRDQDSTTPGVMDQGNSQADIRLSADIRKQVVATTNHFSMDAKNVKIITQNGKVTLRGPVDTEEERAQIAGIAKSVAGDGNVENDLEVKSNQ